MTLAQEMAKALSSRDDVKGIPEFRLVQICDQAVKLKLVHDEKFLRYKIQELRRMERCDALALSLGKVFTSVSAYALRRMVENRSDELEMCAKLFVDPKRAYVGFLSAFTTKMRWIGMKACIEHSDDLYAFIMNEPNLTARMAECHARRKAERAAKLAAKNRLTTDENPNLTMEDIKGIIKVDLAAKMSPDTAAVTG